MSARGAGAIVMNDARVRPVISWGLGPEIKVRERLTAALGFDQDVHSGSNRSGRVYRNRLNLTLSYSLQ